MIILLGKHPFPFVFMFVFMYDVSLVDLHFVLGMHLLTSSQGSLKPLPNHC